MEPIQGCRIIYGADPGEAESFMEPIQGKWDCLWSRSSRKRGEKINKNKHNLKSKRQSYPDT